MAQHDQNVADGSGAVVRGDINDAFAALWSLNSGATAPTVTVAYMWWADTANGVLKQRNSANTAWISHGSIANSLLRADADGNSFSAMPLRVPFCIHGWEPGDPEPDNSGSVKFIKLTADLEGSGLYNEGLLGTSVVSGVTPTHSVTAEILVGPYTGRDVHLLNSEGRYLKPGTSPGTVANDQQQLITGQLGFRSVDIPESIAISPVTGVFALETTTSTSTTMIAAGGSSTTARRGIAFSNASVARTGTTNDVKYEQTPWFERIA